MKTKQAFMAALAGLLLLPCAALAAKKWEKIKSPELNPIQVPEVHRQTLSNGIQLFILEDHELPLFRMTLNLRAGDSFAPKGKTGLPAIAAEVLRSGGSEKLGGDALDELLESRGASIETSTGDLTMVLRVNALIEDSDRVLGIVRDLMMFPAYPEDKLDLALKQSRSAIARRNDDPQQIADREFAKVLWGADHPFVAQVEYADLDNITRQDLLDFHEKWFHPTDAYVAVWGDFDRDEIVQKVNSILGGWPKKAVEYPPVPPTPEVKASVNFILKESVTQSNIRLGHRSIKMDDPDYHALVVMNELLGGGLGSRLFNEVRSRQGLAYRVGSGLGASMAYPGMFQVVCGTKSETTVQAIRACVEEVRRMKTTPVTKDELKRAKDGLLNSYVFNFANKGSIVQRQMNYARWGYPADFLERFPEKVSQVSIEDVQRVAGTFLHPDNLALLVVGKADDFDEPLSVFGDVNTIDVTIPEPKGAEFPEATPAMLAQGTEIMALAAKATGGVDALSKINFITESTDLQLNMMGNIPAKSTRYVQYPGNLRVEIAVMGQNMVQVYNRDNQSGFLKSPQGTKDLGESEMQDFEDDLARDLINLLRDYENYHPQFLEESQIDGTPVDVVLLSPPSGGKKFRAFVDKGSHLIVKLAYRGKSIQGNPVDQEEFLQSYKSVGKIKLPHKSIIHQDGELFLESETSKISTTDVIPAEKFAKSDS